MEICDTPIRASARVDSIVNNLPAAFIKAYTKADTAEKKNALAKKWLRYEHKSTSTNYTNWA